jgi:hypothetical protein
VLPLIGGGDGQFIIDTPVDCHNVATVCRVIATSLPHNLVNCGVREVENTNGIVFCRNSRGFTQLTKLTDNNVTKQEPYYLSYAMEHQGTTERQQYYYSTLPQLD